MVSSGDTRLNVGALTSDVQRLNNAYCRYFFDEIEL